MVKFALFGAGRIGRMHAAIIAADPQAELTYVYDAVGAAAAEVAGKHGARIAPDVGAALGDKSVDAVLIASPTPTHVDLITRAAKAGKAILCEKPIDLDSKRVDQCRDEIRDCNVAIQIGFNRRYDPTHRAVAEAARSGEIGAVEQVIITSRDPGPPPAEYLKASGGLFRDMTIHDFDLARFMLGEEPVEVQAMGSVLVDPAIGGLGDIDSAMITLKTARGVLCTINNSRRAVYGYDQRVEVFGSKGMVCSDNPRPTAVTRTGAKATEVRDPLFNFFIDRYRDAYVAQLADFIDAVEHKRPPSFTFEDGRREQLLADAALESLNTGRTVRVGG